MTHQNLDMLTKIKDFAEDNREPLIAFGLVGTLIAGCSFLLLQQEKAWQQFVIDHNCVIVERILGSPTIGHGYGMTTSGQFGYGMVIGNGSDKTSYDCNDGIRYTR